MLIGSDTGYIAKNAHDKIFARNLHICSSDYDFQALESLHALEEGSNKAMFWRCSVSIYADLNGH